MPQISVIMSVYKEPLDWMAQSIDSILNQIYSDFEFLIVDDNPTDDKLIYFLNDYQKKDSRIKIIVNEQNVGLTKSLNIAIKQAQGKYRTSSGGNQTAQYYKECGRRTGICRPVQRRRRKGPLGCLSEGGRQGILLVCGS